MIFHMPCSTNFWSPEECNNYDLNVYVRSYFHNIDKSDVITWILTPHRSKIKKSLMFSDHRYKLSQAAPSLSPPVLGLRVPRFNEQWTESYNRPQQDSSRLKRQNGQQKKRAIRSEPREWHFVLNVRKQSPGNIWWELGRKVGQGQIHEFFLSVVQSWPIDRRGCGPGHGDICK